ALLLTAAGIAIISGCGAKSTPVTAPVIVENFSIAGTWSGCIVEPHQSCVPVSMTLTDSALTDSTGKVAGSGNWGSTVAIKGKLVNAAATLDGNESGIVEGWAFSGTLSGSTLNGSMNVPGVDSAYAATFTRTP